MLKFKVKSLDEVAEEHRSLYKETKVGEETFFILQVEGVASEARIKDLTTRIASFRTNNTRMAEQIKAFATAAGIELTDDMSIEELVETLKSKAEAAKSQLEQMSKGGSAEVDKQVAARVEAIKTAHAAELAKLKDTLTKLQSTHSEALNKLETMSIENVVLEEAGKLNLKQTARPDIVARARRVFKLVDGKVRALADDGETPIYSATGETELTISEWVADAAAKTATHLFESNSGGGAAGGSGGAGRSGQRTTNPFKRDTWSATEQMKLIKSDPATARRLAAEAGVKLPASVSR